ncbi:WD40 repeat domain-containing protein [Streptomyces yaizuensis]|uniref:Nephrocystin 3-like N-terminal domain-containing protein n=1 Tax=Streptomyces yaizuensis TaxID=2989713 RepID=A0ABQ5NY11_9ACTN|nr:WD40 repeat domain-containing protein [Streptomyces sp. YSPA8]GLF95247.1 hypothetical protein SYYSPA8_13140 [Streptomyces sp. YSPA8]
MVRALVAGVGDFPEPYAGEDELANGDGPFPPLPPVGPATRELASALGRHAVDTGGDALLECDRDTFLGRWKRLRTTATRGEPLIVHFAGHGTEAGGTLFLAASGATTGQLADSCISFGELLLTAELSDRPVLFLLDVCQAGQAVVQQQLADLAARHRQDAPRNVWIIAASAADAEAYGAAFTTATAQVLQQIADGGLDLDPALPHVPLDTLATAVDRHLARTDRAAGWTGRRTLVHTTHPSVTPQEQPFVPNPAHTHTTGPGTGPLPGLDPRLREFALTCSPGLDPLHFATRAAGNQDPSLPLFTGRRSQLRRIQDWINAPGDHPGTLLTVTGSPGSGKSALLGVTACLLHPVLEPRFGRHIALSAGHFTPAPPGTVLAVHARQLTLGQITDTLRHQLTQQRPDLHSTPSLHTEVQDTERDRPEESRNDSSLRRLLEALSTAGDVLIILDALDECADPATVTTHLLTSPHHTAADPPCSITAVFDLHLRTLTQDDPWIHPVLTVLGQARGQGMPLNLIHTAALAHQPPAANHPTPTLTDTHRALRKAAFYLRTTPDTDHRLLYRYFHQALTDHTTPHTHPTTLHHALISSIPTTPQGSPDWATADPYLLRHAADHAHHAGTSALDQLLTDPRYLLHAEPDTLTPYLPHASDEKAIQNADIYRSSTAHDPRRHQLHARRDLLALQALANARPDLAHTITDAASDNPGALCVPRWVALNSRPGQGHNLIDPTHPLSAVAVTEDRNGTPLAVTSGPDQTVRVWEVETGALRRTLTDHAGAVTVVAVAADRDGILLAVTGSHDRTVKVWEVETGTLRHTLTGHAGPLSAVAVAADRDGTLLAVTGSHDSTLRLWDVQTGTLRHTLTGHASPLSAMTVAADEDGTHLVATGTHDGRVQVWDLESGALRHTLTGHTDTVRAIAVAADRDGTLLTITASHDGTVRVWEVETGALRRTLAGHAGPLSAMTVATGRDGAPLAVTSGLDQAVRIWEVETGTLRHTLTGHTDWVVMVAVTEDRDGSLLAVTSGHDSTVKVWDLETGALRRTLTGHTDGVTVMEVTADRDGTLLAVTGSSDTTVRVWEVDTGVRRHTLTGHSGSLSAMTVTTGRDGTPLAITSGRDSTVRAWDLETGRETLRQHLPYGAHQIALAGAGFVVGYRGEVAHFSPQSSH